MTWPLPSLILVLSKHFKTPIEVNESIRPRAFGLFNMGFHRMHPSFFNHLTCSPTPRTSSGITPESSLLCTAVFLRDASHLLFFFNFIFKLYNIVLVLPKIKMNPPQLFPSTFSSITGHELIKGALFK